MRLSGCLEKLAVIQSAEFYRTFDYRVRAQQLKLASCKCHIIQLKTNFTLARKRASMIKACSLLFLSPSVISIGSQSEAPHC